MFPRPDRSLLVTALFGLLSALQPEPVVAEPFDTRPKILLHAMTPTTKNACARGALADCRDAVTAGGLNTPTFVYLLVARGDLPDVAGFECGLAYEHGTPGSQDNLSGVDVFSWTLCASLEFPTQQAGRVWPASGGGNLITWNTETVCQDGETAVAGYFYVTAYSADALEVTARPVSGTNTVTTCAAFDHPLESEDLGHVRFSAGAAEAGCNPCIGDCGPAVSPACAISVTSLDFGEVQLTRPQSRSFTISNTGGGTLAGSATLSCPDFRIAGSPDYNLQSGESKTLQVTFDPQTTGDLTCEINAGPGCPPILASGTGVPAIRCTTTSGFVSFGSIAVGQVVERKVYVHNYGTEPFDVEMSMEPTHAYHSFPCSIFEIPGPTSFVLAPGDSMVKTLRFAPTSSGSASCYLYFGPAECNRVYLTGSASVPPAASCLVSPSNLDFSDVTVGTIVDRVFSVLNNGTTTVSGTVTVQSWVGGFTIVGSPSYTLAPGEARNFIARYSPVTGGSLNTHIYTGCGLVHVEGNSVAAALFGMPDPGRLDFNYVAVGDSISMNFTIYNAGNTPLVGPVVSSHPDFHVDQVLNLAPRAVTTVSVLFKPSTPALRSATIYAPGTRPVSCFANTVAPPTVDPDRLNFGTVAPGDSADRTFTLHNNTGSSLTGTVGEGCPEFLVTNPDYDVAPGASATFTVRFKPTNTALQECLVYPLDGLPIFCEANLAGVAVRPTTWSAIKSRHLTRR